MVQTTFTKQEIIEAGQLIKNAKNIGILLSKRTDGDNVGSSCALYMVLKHLGKSCEMVMLDEMPENLKFVPKAHEVIHEFQPEKYDLFLVTDCGDPKLTGMLEEYAQIFDGTTPMINLDHHISNKMFGTVNIVKGSMATATMVVYKLFKYWNVHITPDVATALLVGIYTDTGSFMHSNTDTQVYEIAGKLMSLGANVRTISKHIFTTTPISTMRLWGRVLHRAKQTEKKITVSYALESDFESLHAKPDELSGVIDYLNAVPDSIFSLLLSEYQGKVKGSLRTLRDDINLSTLAGIFGGGGHAKASGFTLSGKLDIGASWKIQETGIA